MDPDQALSDLRDIFRRVDETRQTDRKAELAVEASIIFEGLDEWIKKGGFLPQEWGSGHGSTRSL